MRFDKIKCIVLIAAIFSSASVFAQKDTVSLTLADAEKAFLEKNFLLLAGQYDVSSAEAAIIQAKLYPNLNLGIAQGVYNPETDKWFDVTKTGETAIALQQVIVLARKRNKAVSVAKINSEIAKYRFYDLIRTLRYELRTSFYSLYFLRQSVSVYDNEIESLSSLIDVYTKQFKEGNIAFKELARLEALDFGLQNERVELLKEAAEKQGNLLLLMSDTIPHALNPLPEMDFLSKIDAEKIILLQIADSAFANRYDLRAADKNVELSQSNLLLQKSLRTPDLTLGGGWDRAGSYINNYNFLSLGIDLPFWNRNQGNIKIAEYQIEQSGKLLAEKKLEVLNEISRAYLQFAETDKLYKTAAPQFDADYDKLLDGITKGYKSHTISLLEFIDYYETYKTSKTEFNKLQFNRLDAIENLNLAAGTTILK